MSSSSIWTTLGVEPGADEARIRSAYAAKLRETNPEDDAEGFKRLRQAYELALRQARWRPRPRRPATEEQADVDDGSAASQDVDDELRELSAPAPAQARPPPISRQTERDDVFAADRKDHAQKCGKLVEALRNNQPPEALKSALHSLLQGPAMQQIDTYRATQEWIVRLLHEARPASLPLIEPVTRYFGWTTRSARVNEWAGPASLFALQDSILNEEKVARYLERIGQKRHEFHRAYKEILRNPARDRRSIVGDGLALRHLGVIGRFLEYTRAEFPDVLKQFDPLRVDRLSKRSKRLLPYWIWVRSIIGGIFVLICLNIVTTAAPAWRQRALDNPSDHYAARQSCLNAALNSRRLDANPGPTPPDCQHAIELMPDAVSLHLYNGIVAISRGEPDLADNEFHNVLAKHPTNKAAYFGLAVAANINRTPDDQVADELATLTGAINGQSEAIDVIDRFAAREPYSAPTSEDATHAYDTPAHMITRVDQTMTDAAYADLGLESLTGEANVHCRALIDGDVSDCQVDSESPEDQGIADVALHLASEVHVVPATIKSVPVEGVIQIHLHFVQQ